MSENQFGAALANLQELQGKTATVVLGSGASIEVKDFKVGPAKLAAFGTDAKSGRQIVLNAAQIAAISY